MGLGKTLGGVAGFNAFGPAGGLLGGLLGGGVENAYNNAGPQIDVPEMDGQTRGAVNKLYEMNNISAEDIAKRRLEGTEAAARDVMPNAQTQQLQASRMAYDSPFQDAINRKQEQKYQGDFAKAKMTAQLDAPIQRQARLKQSSQVLAQADLYNRQREGLLYNIRQQQAKARSGVIGSVLGLGGMAIGAGMGGAGGAQVGSGAGQMAGGLFG